MVFVMALGVLASPFLLVDPAPVRTIASNRSAFALIGEQCPCDGCRCPDCQPGECVPSVASPIAPSSAPIIRQPIRVSSGYWRRVCTGSGCRIEWVGE